MTRILMLLMATWISGCATNAPLQELSKEGPSTAELMRQSTMQSSTHPSNKYLRPVYDTNYSDYTRNANNELNHLFPRLSNPTLVMYIYPHISSSGVPVPGYSTAFSMYEKAVEYALPGETPYSVR